jgi:hypothetical protein
MLGLGALPRPETRRPAVSPPLGGRGAGACHRVAAGGQSRGAHDVWRAPPSCRGTQKGHRGSPPQWPWWQPSSASSSGPSCCSSRLAEPRRSMCIWQRYALLVSHRSSPARRAPPPPPVEPGYGVRAARRRSGEGAVVGRPLADQLWGNAGGFTPPRPDRGRACIRLEERGDVNMARPRPVGELCAQPDETLADGGPTRSSAIWTVLRAAPLRRLSATQKSSRARPSDGSRRMRPT